MQREKGHKFRWMTGRKSTDFTNDGQFEKPKIKKNEKKIYSKAKRKFFKKIGQKEIDDYYKDFC